MGMQLQFNSPQTLEEAICAWFNAGPICGCKRAPTYNSAIHYSRIAERGLEDVFECLNCGASVTRRDLVGK